MFIPETSGLRDTNDQSRPKKWMYNVQNYELHDTNTRLHDYKIQMTRAVLKSELIHVTLFTNIYKIKNYNFIL